MIKSSKTVKRPGGRISFEAKIKCKPLSEFIGEQYRKRQIVEEVASEISKLINSIDEVKVEVKGEEKSGMSRVAIEHAKAFKDYWGCDEDNIVLTKEEEKNG